MADRILNKIRLQAIGQQLQRYFESIEKLRRDKEIEWAEDLRQYKGIYDPDVESKIPANASKVYPKYTRSKVNPCIAKINSMMFPSNDRNWNIETTPKPELKDVQLKMVIEQLMMQDPEITARDVDEAILKFAEELCNRMRTVMDDQLVEMDYTEICKQIIRSAVMYGTGIMKGPMTYTTPEYISERKDGIWVQTERKRRRPYFEFVPIWYFYPDMSSTDFNNRTSCFELHIMDKHDMRMLAKRPDFYGEVISQYLREHKDGDMVPTQWMRDLQTIGDDMKDYTFYRKYSVKEFWGFVDGFDLQSAGIDNAKEDEEYFANIWLLGNMVIKAEMDPTPGGTPHYHKFDLDKDETSIFGGGLPRAIRHSAITIAAASRAMLDNAARVAGPQIVVNDDLMPDEDSDNIYAFRVWRREGRGQDAAYKAIEAIHFESHIDEYVLIIDKFKLMGDEESTFPSFMFGEAVAGSNETARGMSIKSSNVNTTIGDVIKNFDKCSESALNSLYQWNMEWNSDPTIKGDFRVKAQGFTSLLTKELRQQALDYFATTLTPEDSIYISRREFLEERMKLHDLPTNRLLKSQEQVDREMEAQRDREAEGLAKAKMMSEIEYDRSKAAHMNAKAEKEEFNKSVETVKTLNEVKKGTDENDQEAKERELAMKEQEHAMDMRHKEDEHQLKLRQNVQSFQHKAAQREQEQKMKQAQKQEQKKPKTAK